MKHIYLSSCRSRRYQGVRCQGSHRLTAAKPRPSVSDNWNRVVKPSNSSGMIPRNLDNSYVLTLNPISSVTMPLSIGTNYHNQLPVSSSLDTPVASSHPAVSWLSQDDDILFTARSQGHGWGQIQRQHFPSKTPNACRKRYERLIAKKRGTEWDQERLDRLRMRYRELRERTWKPLADATGERWQDVEKAVSMNLTALQYAILSLTMRFRANLENSVLSEVSNFFFPPVEVREQKS